QERRDVRRLALETISTPPTRRSVVAFLTEDLGRLRLPSKGSDDGSEVLFDGGEQNVSCATRDTRHGRKHSSGPPLSTRSSGPRCGSRRRRLSCPSGRACSSTH